MNCEKYIYAGNRSTVLRRMISLGLDVQHVLPTAGSWLEREMPELGLPYTAVTSKKQAIDFLSSQKFDVFVSTGFRFILPITQLQGVHPDTKFVNIHPSFLPDLRGADPIPGAVLFRRDSGVTCHIMDDGVDTGAIICQRKIPHFNGVDAKLLYHLCFRLEPEVFQEALDKSFEPIDAIPTTGSELLYFSFQLDDDRLNAADTAEQLTSRVRAFNTPSKGLRFAVESRSYKAFGASIIDQSEITHVLGGAEKFRILAVFDESIVIGHIDRLVRLDGIHPKPTNELIGMYIQVPQINI